ncbi:MAG: GC-type dockerin domain-anchored protein [Phycisphaerales bacterium]
MNSLIQSQVALLVISTFFASLASESIAQPCSVLNEVQRLLPPSGESGTSVAISGDRAIVGTHLDPAINVEAGSATIYKYDGTSWVKESYLTASDGKAGDFFGWSVAISGDVAVVGAYKKNGPLAFAGAAYVYRLVGDSWIEERKLVPFSTISSSQGMFGYSVSVSGDRIAIGAHTARFNFSNIGAVYTFRYNGSNWLDEQVILRDDSDTGEWFASAVSISGDKIVAGARYDDDFGSSSGSAYLFHHNGSQWVQQAKLLATDGQSGDQFGWSVSISGNTSVIGARGVNGGGSAYIFNYDGSWMEVTKLFASDGETTGQFGYSVSIEEDDVIVGNRSAHSIGDDSGVANLYRYDGIDWIPNGTLLASDGSANDLFGSSVAVSDGVALVGSPMAGGGEAYIFNARVLPCSANLNCDDTLDFFDVSAFLAAFSSSDPIADFNEDGNFNFFDVSTFLVAFSAGCP